MVEVGLLKSPFFTHPSSLTFFALTFFAHCWVCVEGLYLVDLCICWAPQWLGFPGFWLKKSSFFSHRFVEGFFFIFTSFLDHFLKVFSYFYHLFFETFFGVDFLNSFLIFLILTFCANPRRHAFYCSPLNDFAIFEKVSFYMNTILEKYKNVA